MKVNILFFGAVADLVGVRKLESSMMEPAMAADVIERLKAEYPTLRDRNLLFAINEEYVLENTQLNDDDEIAIFFPVSGG